MCYDCASEIMKKTNNVHFIRLKLKTLTKYNNQKNHFTLLMY